MKFLSPLLAFTILVMSPLAQANSGEQKQLMTVLKAFQSAIKNKDQDQFLDLFYDHTVAFVGIDPAKRTGNKPSNNGVLYSTHTGFIGWIAATDKPIEEKVWDVSINTDGNIATMHFKYSFHLDNKLMNSGEESWSLLKIGSEWKIVSVLYSSNRPE